MIKWILIKVINTYKLISPLFGNNCRFHPSCSDYALGALKKYGLFKAVYLILHRLLRCNQFFRGGFDYLK